MPDEFTYDVFLSHSAKDTAVIRELAEGLKKEGVRVWFEEWELTRVDEGLAEEKKMRRLEGIMRSQGMVLGLSVNAYGEEWEQLEAEARRFRNPLETDRWFQPLKLDDAWGKETMTAFICLDWRPGSREDTLAKLREVCRPTTKKAAPLRSKDGKYKAQKIIHLEHTTRNIFSFTFSPDRKRALSADGGSAVRLWKVDNGNYLRVFEGHSAGVVNVAWSADGKRALSGSADYTMRLWEVDTGRCLRVFKGHTERVLSLAWSADGKRLLSGSGDNSVRLWEVDTGRCLRVFEGHTRSVWSVAWSADGKRALSGASDNTVRLWEVYTGRCLRVLEGHTNRVRNVAWSADGKRALSGSVDKTVRIWDLDNGRCLRVFEGHTDSVLGVAWNVDGKHALSGSADKTVRLWDADSGRCLRVLEGHSGNVWGLAWSEDGLEALSCDQFGNIHTWDLSGFVREAASMETFPAVSYAPEQVQYMNAKVLLVGDTGVGKSGLAERLIRREFVPTKSSHARRVQVLETKVTPKSSGVPLHQETVLWDLAGQPAFRLVHQLSMENAALACVLFDCRSETNPFEGAAYWSQALDQARTNAVMRKILVASRIDVGGLPTGRERIEKFVQEHGFAHFVATSASSGEGCEELLEVIRAGIPWDHLPKVTTEGPLGPLRDYLAKLKGERGSQREASPELLTAGQLYEGFSAEYGRKIPPEEFLSHLGRLENTDTVDLLLFHSTGAEVRPETLVLLDPTRVDAYSSALLVAARDEPDGPGHLLEARIREGEFKLDAEERLADPACEKHLLWFVLESLLTRDLALRERIKGEDYIVFPSQCTAEIKFPGVATFGVAYGFAGPVRSIYATLIAQLAHYEGFKKKEFFQDAAAYVPGEGGRCLVRFRDLTRGEAELEVSFEAETPVNVRQGFLEFVSDHLKAKSTLDSVTSRNAYHCGNKSCGNAFEDRVVKARLKAKKRDLICPICEDKTPLVDLLAPATKAAEAVAEQMGSDAKTGRQRMTAALVIKAKEAEGKFDVFLSHNSKEKGAVEKIAKRLMSVGIRPWLDKWHLVPGDTVIDALEKTLKDVPCAALCYGPADTGKWHIMEIRAFVERWAGGEGRMIPVILPGVEGTPELPPFVRQVLWVDMRDWEEVESEGFYRLVCGILERAPGDAPMKRFGFREVSEWGGRRK